MGGAGAKERPTSKLSFTLSEAAPEQAELPSQTVKSIFPVGVPFDPETVAESCTLVPIGCEVPVSTGHVAGSVAPTWITVATVGVSLSPPSDSQSLSAVLLPESPW